MEHLPVILKKTCSFLADCSEAKQRAVCPRGKLLCFLDNCNRVQVHSLHGEPQTASVHGFNFAGFSWVAPATTGQDCVVDEGSQRRSDLLAVTFDLRLCWYSVCEGGGACDDGTAGGVCAGDADAGGVCAGDGEGMSIQQLTTLSKHDLKVELTKLQQDVSVETLRMIGTYNNHVLLLINTDLVCSLTFDPEFSRLVLARPLSIELSTDSYSDSSLPQWVEPLVNLTFVPPLLFVLTQDGLVFVYNVVRSECVGVVCPTAYCQYQCSRQPDSEELLSSLSCCSYQYIAVSPDLLQLLVSTQDNNMVLINLPDYFQMFPGHYNPQFTRSYLLSQRSRVLAPVHQSTTQQEEDNDKLKYGSATNSTSLELYPGFHGYTSRVKRLGQIVEDFKPSQSKTFNFYRASHFESLSAYVTKRNRLLKIPGVRDALSSVSEIQPLTTLKKPWYEEPALHSMEALSKSNFNVSFITGMSKSLARQLSESGLEAALSPSQYHYSQQCVLPAPPGPNLCLVKVEFTSDLIVCYYGTVEAAKEEGVLVGGASLMTDTLVVYHTDRQTYSIARLSQPSWLVGSANTDQLLYMVSSQMLAVTTFDLTQEEFIGKVLMYGSASVAEELCHLNRWDKCSLPVNALETALELRQLDTLAFFLRSRETVAVGYVLGLGDRHVQNILIDKNTAEFIHIDLGVAFEQGKTLPTPETVPFRLTRDVVDGMGIAGVEGVFRRCCEKTMVLMRAHQEELRTIVEVLLHDPLYQWTLNPLKALNLQRADGFEGDLPPPTPSSNTVMDLNGPSSTNKMAERVLLKLQEKLGGIEDGVPLSVNGQVNRLIQEATDPFNLCVLFPGWQPWI